MSQPPIHRQPELLGQTIVVIGGSAGIGLETARRARDELRGRGIKISEVFHPGGANAGADEPYLFGRLRVSGPDPEHRSYRSFASFSDPDGNGWLLQEITTRLPGRVAGDTTYTSANDLASALRQAEAPTGSARSASASGMRTGPTGTPSTWCASRPEKSCRNERVETNAFQQ